MYNILEINRQKLTSSQLGRERLTINDEIHSAGFLRDIVQKPLDSLPVYLEGPDPGLTHTTHQRAP